MERKLNRYHSPSGFKASLDAIEFLSHHNKIIEAMLAVLMKKGLDGVQLPDAGFNEIKSGKDGDFRVFPAG